MAAKAKAKKTPAMMLWAMIDAERCAQKMSLRMLGQISGYSSGTVSLDSNCPERIPLERLFVYFAALGIDAATVIRPIAEEFVLNLTQSA